MNLVEWGYVAESQYYREISYAPMFISMKSGA